MSQIDVLVWKFKSCRSSDECREAFKKIVNYLADNWVYLIGWNQFEAWGAYYISPDRKRAIYVGANPRTDPVTRWVDIIEFSDPAELANRIWRDQKGVIPFRRIAERIKDVFGVDVEMSDENKFIRVLFGEAGDC
jgi:hypothetical protein